MKNKQQFNPVAPRRVALMFEPVVRSGFLLYLYVLYMFVKFYRAKFNFYELAYNCLFVKIFGYKDKTKLLILSMFATQLSATTSAVILFISCYVSAGNTLPQSVLKETNLEGKVALVTGGYSGIGYETVLQLLKWNCKVVVCGRNKTKATNAIQRMKSTESFNPDNVTFIEMDLDDLLSVKNAAKRFLNEFDRLDFLINNAGIWVPGLKKTHNNLESQFSSNFLGHFYLTNLLFDILKKSESRVINLSSIAHYKYDPSTDAIFNNKSTTSLDTKKYNTYYGRSKLFNHWFTHCLHRRHLCSAPADKLVSGGYYSERRLSFVSKHAHNYELEEKLWNLAEELVEKFAK